MSGWEETVNTGDRVRVTLMDDRRIEGTISNLAADSITVETGRIYDDKEIIVVSAKEVKSIELQVGSGKKTALLVFGIVVGTIALIGIGFAASGGLGSFGFESS